MAEETTQDPQGESANPDPSQGDDGKSSKPETPSQDDLPEKFKGKSASDIAKSYIELEKKLGKRSEDDTKVRSQLQQWEKLGQVLESDPELYKQVEAAITRLSGKKSETTIVEKDPEVKDIRITQENTIIGDFEKDFGISSLKSDKRKELHEKIAGELADMLDPGGKKSTREVIDTIPLPRLRNYLEKAYKLATSGDREERARLEALVQQRQNREASFGTFPSSSVGSQGQLSEDERKVAKKMGISEEAYLKQKKALAE